MFLLISSVLQATPQSSPQTNTKDLANLKIKLIDPADIKKLQA